MPGQGFDRDYGRDSDKPWLGRGSRWSVFCRWQGDKISLSFDNYNECEVIARG
jgi:hypothetical protein